MQGGINSHNSQFSHWELWEQPFINSHYSHPPLGVGIWEYGNRMAVLYPKGVRGIKDLVYLVLKSKKRQETPKRGNDAGVCFRSLSEAAE